MSIENKLHKGDFAIAHIERSYQSLLAGRGVYSRYFVIEVLSSTRDGVVKTFRDNNVTAAPSRVDRYITIYGFPQAFADVAREAFNAQALDFTGYQEKADLKAALEALQAQKAA